MKRPIRIAFELLGPPIIGTVVIGLALIAGHVMDLVPLSRWGSLRQVPELTLVLLMGAYFCSGIQCIFCTVIMEWQFSRGLHPASWRSVGLSSFLGFCSGAVIVLTLGLNGGEAVRILLIFGGMGLVVGFIMGLLIKTWSGGGKNPGGDSP